MINIINVRDPEQIFHYQLQFEAPYFFPVEYNTWLHSFADDTDGEGRTLFRDLSVKAAYRNGKLVGFIQYGNTAFGFDDSGEISSQVSYCVIRNLYFDENCADAGDALLQAALDTFPKGARVYAFFHYFGMTCFARHGKLFQRHAHIEEFLKIHGFVIEHENVYDSSMLQDDSRSEVTLLPQELSKGHHQYVAFTLSGNSVGGCEIHFVSSNTAYLRWIFVNHDLTGQGIGSQCMAALQHWLYLQGIRRFDTDTALQNTVAQHFYEKNHFTREGITRSYYRP